MKNMTIAQALKEKNKLAFKIKVNWFKIKSKNSLIKGAHRPYDIHELKDQTLVLVDELIDLKTKIHQASAPVRDKIFRLSELKAVLSTLGGIPTNEGITKDKYENEFTEMDASIKTIELDEMMEQYRDEIDDLQDHLDNFNYTTMIS